MIASNETFVLAAYLVTWIVLLGYSWRLVRKDASARAAQARGTGRGGEAAR